MKYFALRGDLFFYRNTDKEKLKEKLEKMGFEYREPQMGGGGETPIQEITVSFFTFKEFWAGIFVGVLGNAIYDLIKKLFTWHKSKNVKPTENVPNVFISIYPPLGRKRFSFFIRIDKEPTREDIMKEINKAIKETKDKV